MNICFVNDSDCFGGGEIWVLRAGHVLRTHGHQVAIACRHESLLHAQCVRSRLDHITYLDTDSAIDLEISLRRFLELRQVDVLYCTVSGHSCEVRALERVANEFNATRSHKMTIILKAGLPPIGRLTPRHYGCDAGPAVRRLHVVAPSITRAFVDWRPELDNGFVELFREGVELDRFQRDPVEGAHARQRWRIPNDNTVVTCLARLVDGMKGQSVLLRAVPRLLELHPHTVFVLAGDGEDRVVLEELAEDLNITAAVRFTGQVDDVVPLLAASDILCHPSIHDGLPNAIVEAMSMCLPVVASRVGAIPDLVVDGTSGLLVRPNDVRELTAALECLLCNDHNERIRFGSEGNARVRDNWDLRTNLVTLTARLEEEVREFAAAPTRRTAPAQAPAAVHVLFLLNHIRLGGEETELAILARYLDQKRFRMSVLSSAAASEIAPALEKITAWGIPVDTTCHAIPGYSDKVDYILTKIKQEGVGLVVACQDTRLAYEVFAHLAPHECRLIEHGGVLDDVGRISKDRTTYYIGVSSSITSAAAPLMKRPDAAVFIPSMVDTDEFEDPKWAPAREWSKLSLVDTCLRSHGLPDDTCVVAFVGRLDPRKRVEDVIQAANNLRFDPVPALFLVVGGADALHPEYMARLQEEARPLVEAHTLVFTGPRGDIAGLLSACDILVLPSVGEGMAHVIGEAGAAGLAVVATDDGAAREQLDGGRCGILVGPGDIGQLTEALRRLIGSGDARRALGARLRQRVKARYSARVVIAQWHSVLEAAARQLDQSLRGDPIRRASAIHVAQAPRTARNEVPNSGAN